MRCQRYQDCFKLCQREFSNAAVHDLRVATRRLLTLLEILETLFLGMKGRKLRRELKQSLDCLDELMDTQVQIAYVEDEMAEVQDIAAFLKYLHRREATLLKQVEHTVRAISLPGQIRRLANLHQTAEARLQVPNGRLHIYRHCLSCSEGRGAANHVTGMFLRSLGCARRYSFNSYGSCQLFCRNLPVSMHKHDQRFLAFVLHDEGFHQRVFVKVELQRPFRSPSPVHVCVGVFRETNTVFP